MKKSILAALFLSLPVLSFLTVWQGYRYQRLQKEVAAMEVQQQRYFEENKRSVMGIEYLRSPERVERLAQEELGLVSLTPDKILHVEIAAPEERQGIRSD